MSITYNDVIQALGIWNLEEALNNALLVDGAEVDYYEVKEIEEDDAGRDGYVYHEGDNDLKLCLFKGRYVCVDELTIDEIITAWNECYADSTEFNPVSLRNMLNEMIDAHSIHV